MPNLLFVKNEKWLKTLIHEEKRDGIGQSKMCPAYFEKQKTTKNGRNRNTKSRKNQNAMKKET